MFVVCGRRLGKWNQALDNAPLELDTCLESEGVRCRLATDYSKAQQRRRGKFCEVVKDEGQVLHHFCWPDDLYAMAGTMNHLTGILEDIANAIERLGVRWKRKVFQWLLLGLSEKGRKVRVQFKAFQKNSCFRSKSWSFGRHFEISNSKFEV